jgi:CheY-like chemotaxis protein/two-component sensor histidine kinase
MIERQVAHMVRLVDDLLDVSRISRGKILLRKERVDLARLVQTTADDQRASLEKSGLALRIEVPDRPVHTLGDPTRLAQAVDNLVQNAGKFTDRGGSVEVRLEVHGPVAVVRVTDTGIGMEPHVVPHIFEPFAQADRSLDRSRGGLGLGLALVKGLVELHGGRVEAESQGLGKGSEIRLLLPIEAAPVVAEDRGAELPRSPSARRILVIEDNIDAAESLSDLLQMMGHEVHVEHTGAAGVAAAKERLPDLVICDIGLPGSMNGYAVARALRAIPELRSAQLVALTGYGGQEDRRRTLEAGFQVHLTKPVELEALDDLLSTTLPPLPPLAPAPRER